MRSLLALLLLVAGPAGAGATPDRAPGDAWEATYRVQDARGRRELVMLCDDDTVELRIAGEPVRVWQRRADGIEHRVLFPTDGRVVVFAPGDLRALGRGTDWARVRGLVPVAQRPPAEAVHRRLDGRDVQVRAGRGVDADVVWLPDAGLPARYVGGGQGAARIELRGLRRVDPGTAFTPMHDLREIDGADLGDDALDPFARRFVVMGF